MKLVDLSSVEWQHVGNDSWVLGVKIRGIVRKRLAEVYLDGCYRDDPRGGWVCLIHYEFYSDSWSETNLSRAVEAVEKKLGIDQDSAS